MYCGCPTGYILNQITGMCEKYIRENVSLNESPLIPPVLCGNVSYMARGTAFYNQISSSQFPLYGQNSTTPTFKDVDDNIIAPRTYLVSGQMWISNGSADHGRMNQAGIALLPPVNDWQGYIRCITVKEDEEYFVAIGASYGFALYVDGELAVFFRPSFPAKIADYLHVFPLDLAEGPHTLRFEARSGYTGELPRCFDANGYNIPCTEESATSQVNTCPNLGILTCEVFVNITPQILQDCSIQANLDLLYAKTYINGIGQNLSTLYLRGAAPDTGQNGNYLPCAQGTMNGCIEDRMVCQYLDSVVPIPCCFRLVECSTGDTLVTDTTLLGYIGKIIKITEEPGCWRITGNSEEGCPGAISVTVSSSYDDCDTCTAVYYRLTDCRGVFPPRYTTTDLSAYDGKVIKIPNYNNCWVVARVHQAPAVSDVIVVESFQNCEQCL